MAQITIDNVGVLTTPKLMMQAIDDNFDELYADDASSISDVVYGAATWDGVTTIAASKNVIRDKIVDMDATIAANTAKDTNVSTDLAEGTSTETTVLVTSSDGTDATLLSASVTRAGLLTKAKFDEITANTAKVTNADHTGDVTGATVLTIADDAVTYAKMQDATATDKILGRATAGAGVVEEIACTAAGRALIDDADAAAQLITLGVTATAAELNILDGVTSTATELNILDGVTSTAAELNYTDGVTSAIQTQLNGKLANIVEDTTPELGGELDAGAHSIGFTQQAATGDGTTTIDWRLGNKFKFTFGAANETFTLTAPSNPCNLLLILVQDGTGSRTATWPATVKWPGGVAPTLSIGANDIDIVSLYFDGTNYFAQCSYDFS